MDFQIRNICNFRVMTYRDLNQQGRNRIPADLSTNLLKSDMEIQVSLSIILRQQISKLEINPLCFAIPGYDKTDPFPFPEVENFINFIQA